MCPYDGFSKKRNEGFEERNYLYPYGNSLGRNCNFGLDKKDVDPFVTNNYNHLLKERDVIPDSIPLNYEPLIKKTEPIIPDPIIPLYNSPLDVKEKPLKINIDPTIPPYNPLLDVKEKPLKINIDPIIPPYNPLLDVKEKPLKINIDPIIPPYNPLLGVREEPLKIDIDPIFPNPIIPTPIRPTYKPLIGVDIHSTPPSYKFPEKKSYDVPFKINLDASIDTPLIKTKPNILDVSNSYSTIADIEAIERQRFRARNIEYGVEALNQNLNFANYLISSSEAFKENFTKNFASSTIGMSWEHVEAVLDPITRPKTIFSDYYLGKEIDTSPSKPIFKYNPLFNNIDTDSSYKDTILSSFGSSSNFGLGSDINTNNIDTSSLLSSSEMYGVDLYYKVKAFRTRSNNDFSSILPGTSSSFPHRNRDEDYSPNKSIVNDFIACSYATKIADAFVLFPETSHRLDLDSHKKHTDPHRFAVHHTVLADDLLLFPETRRGLSIDRIAPPHSTIVPSSYGDGIGPFEAVIGVPISNPFEMVATNSPETTIQLFAIVVLGVGFCRIIKTMVQICSK